MRAKGTPDPLADKRDVGEVEFLDKTDDALPEIRFIEAGTRIDRRTTVSRKIDGVYRIRIGEGGCQTSKIFQLRADRVHKDQRRPFAGLLITQARAYPEDFKAGLVRI